MSGQNEAAASSRHASSPAARAIGGSHSQLASQLADSDGGQPDGAGSTLAELRRELDTLAQQLRIPVPADPYEEESACRRVVQAIGRDPTLGDLYALYLAPNSWRRGIGT